MLLLLLTEATAVETALPKRSRPPPPFITNTHSHTVLRSLYWSLVPSILLSLLLHSLLPLSVAQFYSVLSSHYLVDAPASHYIFLTLLPSSIEIRINCPSCVKWKIKSIYTVSVPSLSSPTPWLPVLSYISFIQQLNFSAGWVLSACCCVENKLLHKSPSSAWKTHLCPT